MKKLVFLCLTACLGMWASAQKVYFLYLQSDDQSPFYVRMGDKIHSSAASGFLILPNLTDSSYAFALGFAKKSEPEARFSVNINGTDKGYIIKNFDDGLALFDFQSLSVVKANTVQKDNTVYETKSDKFSHILSKAASDPSILKVPVAKKEEPAKPKPVENEPVTAKVDESKLVQKPLVDTVSSNSGSDVSKSTAQSTETTVPDVAVNGPVATEAKVDVQETTAKKKSVEKKEEIPPVEQVVKKEVVAPVSTVFRPSVVSRYSESSTTEGFGVVYFDKKAEGVDTIRILIPAPKVKLVATDNTTTSNEPIKTEKEELTAEVKKSETPEESTTLAPKTSAVNSSCKSIASEKDFMKLRKRMAAKETEDDMLDEAKKDFRSRCYSVEQVRYLSTLFLTSASKYQFFDAAFLFVTDKSNFASLGAEIRDEHYSKRFKALIGE